jgi:hypothetical protein
VDVEWVTLALALGLVLNVDEGQRTEDKMPTDGAPNARGYIYILMNLVSRNGQGRTLFRSRSENTDSSPLNRRPGRFESRRRSNDTDVL